MKKSLIALALCSTIAHGMDINTHEYMINGTKIHVQKGCVVDVDGNVDAIIVGRNQQKLLGFKSDINCGITLENTIYLKDHQTNNILLLNGFESKILAVEEPVIICENGKYSFKDQRFERGFFANTISYKTLHGDKALARAKRKLELCYDSILNIAPGFLCKSIALPALGVPVGFPGKEAAEIAVKSIIEFLEKNPEKYQEIQFFVTEDGDLTHYHELFLTFMPRK